MSLHVVVQVDLVTEIANTVSRLTFNYGPMWCVHVLCAVSMRL